VSKTLLFKSFFLPAAVLAVVSGLFGYLEHKRGVQNDSMREIMKIILTTSEWTARAGVLRGEEAVIRDLEIKGEGFAQFATFFETLRRHALEAEASFLTSVGDENARLSAWGGILPLETFLKEIEGHIAADSRDYASVKKAIAGLKESLDQIHLSELAIYQKNAQALLDTMERDETKRHFLIFLMALSGLVLIVMLLDAVYRHKKSADRAFAEEKRNETFLTALQATDVGVLIRDMRGANHPVVFINDSFAKMTGYSFDDALRETGEFLFGWKTDETAKGAYRRTIQEKAAATLDLLLYRKDGAPFWSEWHLSPIKDQEGELVYYVSLLTDKTAIKQTQDDLLQAKAAAEQASIVKTTFLAMMSHEIRTPINGVLGVLKLLEETYLDTEQKHLVSIANASSQALHTVINDILDYAKLEAGKIEIVPRAFSLLRLLEECLTLGQSILGKKEVELKIEFQGDTGDWFLGDDARMRQIILNLISNAIKFTERGSITVRVVSLLDQEVAGAPGKLMRFEVQDTGIGISEADIPSLFQEFQQVERSFNRRFSGTGLGLAICRRLITMMGGDIGVESHLGRGSKFWFMLPLQKTGGKANASARLMTEQNMTPSASGDCCRLLKRRYNVLLAEDNETNRFIAMRYLEKAGFSVADATNGIEAFEKAKAHDYDLILMDVSMPEMDGLQASDQIRALGGHNAKVPIIALTAHAMAGDRDMCLAAGMNDYLNKPLNYRTLVDALEKWLHVAAELEEDVRLTGAGVVEPEAPPSRQTLSAVPVFDERVLQAMRDNLGGDAVGQVTRSFLSDSAKRIAEMSVQDMKMLEHQAHTLKSSGASCGLMRFAGLMADLEAASAMADQQRAERLLSLARDVYDISCARLQREKERFV